MKCLNIKTFMPSYLQLINNNNIMSILQPIFFSKKTEKTLKKLFYVSMQTVIMC